MVRIRSLDEIVSTLDEQGRCDGIPFMPEMSAFCGRVLRIQGSAHKTCDTIGKSGIRKVKDCFHLETARCDGAQHGNCQADCLIFWHRAWLEPAHSAGPTAGNQREDELLGRVHRPAIDDERFACQATELLEFSQAPRGSLDVARLYLRDLISGNTTFARWIKVLAFSQWRKLISTGIAWRLVKGGYDRLQARTGGAEFPMPPGTIPDGSPTPAHSLQLRKGDRVRVKSYDEIRKTLTVRQRNRGLWFDAEMVRFCNREFVVDGYVQQIIDESTGRMLRMKTPCVKLQGTDCRAEISDKHRLFCPRAIPAYWREIWLEKVEPDETPVRVLGETEAG